MTPGWYRDPHNGRVLRWWDGRQWTAPTRPDPARQQTIRNNWAIALLILFIPAGIIYTWIAASWTETTKAIVTILALGGWALAAMLIYYAPAT